MLAHLLCRFLGWLVPDDLFDIDLGDLDDGGDVDEPRCWMCDGPANGVDVLGMHHCLPCYL